MRKSLAAQRLVGVFLIAALLFNYPVLSLFDRAEPFAGFPMLYLFTFVAWAVVIAAVAWIVERRVS